MDRVEVLVTTRFAEGGPDFLGDYCEVQIDVNGEPAETYGDRFGRDRMNGFLDGLRFMYGEECMTVTFKDVADYPI